MLTVTETLSQLQYLRRAWRDLEHRDPQASFFLGHDWLCCVLTDSPGRWRILTLHDDTDPHRLLCALALRMRVIWNAKPETLQTELDQFGPLGLGQDGGLLCDPAEEARVLPRLGRVLERMPWVRFALRDARSPRRARYIARGLDAGSVRLRWSSTGTDDGTDTGAALRSLTLQGAQDFGFRQRQLRKLIRTERQRLVDTGPLAIHTRDDEDAIAAVLDIWKSNHARLHGRRGLPKRVENHRNALRILRDTGQLFMPVLEDAGQIVAGVAHAFDRRTGLMHVLVPGHDGIGAPSPTGLILHAHAIASARKEGLRTYELGRELNAIADLFDADALPTISMIADRHGGADRQDLLDPACIGIAADKIEAMSSDGRKRAARAALAHLDRVTKGWMSDLHRAG